MMTGPAETRLHDIAAHSVSAWTCEGVVDGTRRRRATSGYDLRRERGEMQFAETEWPVTEATVLMTGIAFGESPRWHAQRLWFADWGAGEIIALDMNGEHEVVARVPTAPLCLDSSPGGGVLIVAGGEKRILKLSSDQSLVPFADLSGLSDKPWNDIAIDGHGNAFVNNIGFDFPGGEFAKGMIAVIRPDGSAREVASELAFPNGMAITRDGSSLIVAESYGACLTAFDIGADGALSNRRVWAELPGAAPDGICLSPDGTVWYADVPNQRCVHVEEGGGLLDTIEIDRGCFACALGGPDGRTLFMVATEWTGEISAGPKRRTGQVLTATV
jgi:sugar lactone lactonase YvrE